MRCRLGTCRRVQSPACGGLHFDTERLPGAHPSGSPRATFRPPVFDGLKAEDVLRQGGRTFSRCRCAVTVKSFPLVGRWPFLACQGKAACEDWLASCLLQACWVFAVVVAVYLDVGCWLLSSLAIFDGGEKGGKKQAGLPM